MPFGHRMGVVIHVLGTMDLENRKITETFGRLHHAQLMDMIRQTLG